MNWYDNIVQYMLTSDDWDFVKEYNYIMIESGFTHGKK